MSGGGERGGEEIRSRWYDVDGIRWHVRSAQHETAPGTRPAVVLVQGFVVSSWFHEPLMAELAPAFDVFAPDLPGFGRSEGSSKPISVQGHAAELARWLEVAGLAPTAVLGTSYGSQITAELAATYPDHVDRAVLVSPTLEPSARPLHRLAYRWLQESGHERAMLKRAIGDYFRAGPRRTLGLFRAMRSHRMEDTAPHVHMPVLVVCGGDDPLVSREWREELTARLPDGRLVVIPDEPHPLNFTSAEPLAHAIRPFLSAAAGSSERAERIPAGVPRGADRSEQEA